MDRGGTQAALGFSTYSIQSMTLVGGEMEHAPYTESIPPEQKNLIISFPKWPELSQSPHRKYSRRRSPTLLTDTGWRVHNRS